MKERKNLKSFRKSFGKKKKKKHQKVERVGWHEKITHFDANVLSKRSK